MGLTHQSFNEKVLFLAILIAYSSLTVFKVNGCFAEVSEVITFES